MLLPDNISISPDPDEVFKDKAPDLLISKLAIPFPSCNLILPEFPLSFPDVRLTSPMDA